jgi:hypothetical protein
MKVRLGTQAASRSSMLRAAPQPRRSAPAACWQRGHGCRCAGRMKFCHGAETVSPAPGQWKEGLRSGQGTFKYPNGDWYKGSWHEGKKSGRGTYFSHAGACWYMGIFQDGEFIDGEWKFKDSSCYKVPPDASPRLAMQPPAAAPLSPPADTLRRDA